MIQKTVNLSNSKRFPAHSDGQFVLLQHESVNSAKNCKKPDPVGTPFGSRLFSKVRSTNIAAG